MANLHAFHPEVGELVLGFAFSDILSREGIDLRTRKMLTVAKLAAMGTAPGHADGQLDHRVHSTDDSAAVTAGCRDCVMIARPAESRRSSLVFAIAAKCQNGRSIIIKVVQVTGWHDRRSEPIAVIWRH